MHEHCDQDPMAIPNTPDRHAFVQLNTRAQAVRSPVASVLVRLFQPAQDFFVSSTTGIGGVLRTYFLYASIQSEAISRWAVLRYWPAHTSLWSFLSSLSFT